MSVSKFLSELKGQIAPTEGYSSELYLVVELMRIMSTGSSPAIDHFISQTSVQGNTEANAFLTSLKLFAVDVSQLNPEEIAGDWSSLFGNVNGPASSLNSAIARFDGTTGKLLKNSVVSLSDLGDLLWSTDGSGSIGAAAASRPYDVRAQNALFAAANGTQAASTSGFFANLDQFGLNGSSAATATAFSVSGQPAGTLAFRVGTTNYWTMDSAGINFQSLYSLSGALQVAINRLEFTQISTPANPAASKNRLYFKSDDKLYKLNSAGVEAEVGGGGGANPVVMQVSGNTSLSAADSTKIIECNSSGGGFNLNLPAPASGLIYYIKDSTGDFDANNVTLVRFGGEMIEGVAANYALSAAWGDYIIYSNGTNWLFLG